VLLRNSRVYHARCIQISGISVDDNTTEKFTVLKRPVPHIIAESANQIGADTALGCQDSWVALSREGRLKVTLLPPERRITSHSDTQETGATEWAIVTRDCFFGEGLGAA